MHRSSIYIYEILQIILINCSTTVLNLDLFALLPLVTGVHYTIFTNAENKADR